VKFGDIASSITERVDDPSAAGVDRYVGLEHLDPDATAIRRWGSPSDVESTKLRFYPGDVIYGRRRAYQRKLGVADFDGICSAHALVLRAKPAVCLPEFLPYFLQSDAFHQRALDISVGSLSPTINWKTLAVQEFALPPLDEQQRMVETFVACDRKTEALLLAAESAVSLALSTFDSLVSTADVPVVQLDSVAEWRRGYSFKGSDYADDEGFPFLTLASVDRGGGYRTDGLKYLKTEPKASCIAVPGDLLVANTDLTPGREFIGRPFLVPESLKTAGFSHHLSRIMTKDESLREWLFWELQSPSSRKFVRSVARGSTVIMLDTRALGKWPVRVPPARTRAEVLHRIRLVMTLELKARGQLAATANLRTVLLSELVGGGGVH
jgi:restriction endonuclease S subunit